MNTFEPNANLQSKWNLKVLGTYITRVYTQIVDYNHRTMVFKEKEK